ncbi:MAG TPA: hypothetical protein VM779_03235 [Thermoanaerobaculia bacterium]|nr:hypothetical protein [Thermoanaerobaculia bacterium]
MKHGDKKKGKASKASKSAGKKSSKASKGKVVQSAKAKSSASKASKKASKPQDNGVASRARAAGDVSFSNPAVGSAFRHAVKKYPNAFRKLTD